ncbi:large conductance mechanosensitive channel protein MscL [Dactylosporangium aurantiacum]|uniref:Large conductance mechanosensitive channel protein MscL n=1 Tax=Dactylosporangium aurantiacum TaxID=35754 RepID=A0A9Q9IIR3_9ACTN|nr:large conductance mechanosensitive channel protein MscL [Dactylosporangium aurantiacum]MDG6104953.1 large conductance mechanosensitive channel protein MscL [Dactylosporangium aurantiacum]UWZ55518.1 large conductance mechanosensitive channel protein MscL [Dactylosporangium aurantiacum]
MRKLWAEFKAIAIGGTVLDLALGFIIGSAFATLVQSFVTNLFLQVVASVVGEPDFQKLQITLHRTPIKYGVFLNDLLQFLLLAVALFVIIKFMTWIGVERGRSLDQRQCPFCYDRIPGAALICRSCGQQLVEDLPTLAEAEHLLDEREARRWPTLPVLPLPPLVIPRRRPPSGPPTSPTPTNPTSPAPTRDETRAGAPPTGEPSGGAPAPTEQPTEPTEQPTEPTGQPTGAGEDETAAGATASGDGTPGGRSAASATPAPEPPPARRPAG